MKYPLLQLLRTIIFSYVFFLSAQLSAATSADVFKRHVNPVFFETGSFYGDGIDSALKAGFKEIYSVELSPALFDVCQARFKKNKNVHLYQGDSTEVLRDILPQISQRTTFWLDGHYSEGVTVKGYTNTPILAELTLIGKHPIKTHTILIDDVRQFGTKDFDYISIDKIVQMIKSINPDYQISYEDGFVANDVLVAEIPDTKQKK